jgi:hypothetical protein
MSTNHISHNYNLRSRSKKIAEVQEAQEVQTEVQAEVQEVQVEVQKVQEVDTKVENIVAIHAAQYLFDTLDPLLFAIINNEKLPSPPPNDSNDVAIIAANLMWKEILKKYKNKLSDKSLKSKYDKKKPTRARSAFVIYCTEMRKKHPNKSMIGMVNFCSTEWKKLDKNTSESYRAKAHQLKVKYEEEMKEYNSKYVFSSN